MEIKRNEATLNRPEGDRVVDAPAVVIDLPSIISQLKEEKAWEKNDRNGLTIFKSGGITMVVVAIKEDATIPENNVNAYLSMQVLKGKLIVSSAEGDVVLIRKQSVMFHPNYRHSVLARRDSIILLTTYSSPT